MTGFAERIRIRIVTIRLEFSDATRDPCPVSIAFWQSGQSRTNDPDCQLFPTVAEVADPKAAQFSWTTSVQAFCVLLLRIYAKGSKPLQGKLDSRSSSLAQPLVEVVRRRLKPDGKPNWLHSLFFPRLRVRSQDRLLPESLFLRNSNAKKGVFWIELGRDWATANLEIMLDKKEMPYETATLLAEKIEGQIELNRKTPTTARLTGKIELRVLDPHRRQFLPIEACDLPVGTRSGISLRIRFDRLAYPYVIWFTAAGVVQPLYPWQEFAWNRKQRPSPGVEFTLPPTKLTDGSGHYPIESREGIETALVLASEKPAPRDVVSEMKAICSKLQRRLPKALLDAKQVYWLSDRRAASAARPSFRLGQPQTLETPMEKWVNDAVQHFGSSFPCIFGACFTTRASD